jgi:hypothetical protein
MFEERPIVKRIYELVDSGKVDVYAVMEACLWHMNDQQVEDMAHNNRYFEFTEK